MSEILKLNRETCSDWISHHSVAQFGISFRIKLVILEVPFINIVEIKGVVDLI